MRSAKVEDGELMIEWYRRGEEVVFDRAVCSDDRTCIQGLAYVIGQLQARIDDLERRLAATP